jgi:hypothetical protein
MHCRAMVRDARNRLWQVAPTFSDLEALNNWLEDRCKVLWTDTAHGSLPGSVADAWEAERAALMPLPTALLISASGCHQPA